jgi:arylsulfatase
LNEESLTIAEILSRKGYRTYLSGKWHVGEREEHWPLKRGFERYFGLLSGASSYYELIEDQPRVRQMALDDEPWMPPADDFYMTDAITDYAALFIRDHVAEYTRRKPFFLYVPFTAPHWPLHALEKDIDKYEGRYDVGWDVLREQRLKRMKELGIVEDETKLPERPPSIPAWDALASRSTWSRRMEVYAAMVDRMDQGIGRIIRALDETKTIRNTVIFFLSDNGASAEDVTGRNLNDPASTIGERGSYDAYREPWAHVSNTPFRYYKSWMHEGGIATPLIVYWQRGIRDPGRLIHEPGHIIDLMSTTLELADVTYPENYHGRPIEPTEGKSLVPLLMGKDAEPHPPLYWEHFGTRAVRQGDWKLVAGKSNAPWELYNLNKDRNELYNMAPAHPEKVEALEAAWAAWANRVGVRND